ncbi:hypothetical protein I204_02906 [Kwoniella mangroviensis CBS 8886]|nr:hypothetical protein I204_02906 [Kwoniella mangroviensis CBS 8886]
MNDWMGWDKITLELQLTSLKSFGSQALGRLYVAWLNQESPIHGGRFVDQWPLGNRERFAYCSDEAWEHGYTSSGNFTRIENTPPDEWPTYPRAGDQSAEYDLDSGSE